MSDSVAEHYMEKVEELERKHKIRVDLLAQVYRCNGANLCDGCKHELEVVLKQYKPKALKAAQPQGGSE